MAILKRHWNVFQRHLGDGITWTKDNLKSTDYSIISHDLRDTEGLIKRFEEVNMNQK
jgi:hypothetical protein